MNTETSRSTFIALHDGLESKFSDGFIEEKKLSMTLAQSLKMLIDSENEEYKKIHKNEAKDKLDMINVEL